MDWRRIKTLLICLLLVSDVFLAGFWIQRVITQKRSNTEYTRGLIALLSENGLEASADDIPSRTAPVLEFSRDKNAEIRAAGALLGECESSDAGGGIIDYTGDLGAARFRNMGEFSISLHAAITLQSPQTELGTLALKMGLVESVQTPERSGSGYRFASYAQGLPVWGCYAQFDMTSEGGLTGVHGAWPLGGVFAETPASSRSASFVLLSLSQSLHENGITPGKLLGMELGYRMTAPSPGILRLTPYWRVSLEAGVYYADALTGLTESFDQQQLKQTLHT